MYFKVKMILKGILREVPLCLSNLCAIFLVFLLAKISKYIYFPLSLYKSWHTIVIVLYLTNAVHRELPYSYYSCIRISLYECNLCSQTSADEHMSCLQSLAVTNKAAMNDLVYVLLRALEGYLEGRFLELRLKERL